MVVTNVEFASAENSNEKAGNIFYNSGLITLTRKSNQRLTSNWDLSFKSTETIYEHEYLLIVNEDEFNVSTNPSAVIEIGRETGYVTGSDGKIYKTTTYPGVKYIKKKSTLENGDTIVLTQQLNVKGASFMAPKGTIVRKIRLVPDNAEQIEGKINNDTIVILTKFVKKSV